MDQVIVFCRIFAITRSACHANALCMPRQYLHCMAAQFMDMRAPASLYLTTGPRRTENGSRSAREVRMEMLCSENGLLLYGSRVRLVPIISDEDPSNQTHP